MTRSRAILVVALAVALLAAGSIVSHVAAGPTGVHQSWLVAPRLTICDRHYGSSDAIHTRAELDASGGPIVLVDPGILGLFAPCPGPDTNGNRPCTTDGSAGPCATVVVVRVGEDSYREYALAGGP
jgi:hypothetical protein